VGGLEQGVAEVETGVPEDRLTSLLVAVELKVPEAGESIVEVQVGDWLKEEGEVVELDEPIVVLETDKASMELSAPVRKQTMQDHH